MSKRIVMGVLMPSIYIGGGENATLFAIEHTDARYIDWHIVVVTDPWVTESFLWHFADFVKVYYAGNCYYRGEKVTMNIQQALMELDICDGVISWELDEKRSRMFNACKGKKIHWIFRHDFGHKKFVKDDHILLTCSEGCIPDFGNVDRNRILIIPSALEPQHCYTNKSKCAIREEWGIKEELVIGYLGRMDRNKNIYAVARTVAGTTNMIAMCYGSKNWQSSEIERDIAKIAGNRLIWHEPILNVAEVLKGADVLLLPSYSEVFSLTLLEAWASRIPVVCSDVGEVPFIQKKFGRVCTLIDPNADGETIREKIFEAINDIEAIERAHNIVIEHYNTDIVSAEWTRFLLNSFAS
jgi:glycosyltransferase involved in cell wall biosynthesis